METVEELVASTSRGDSLYTFLNQAPLGIAIIQDKDKQTKYQTQTGTSIYLDRTQKRAQVTLTIPENARDFAGLTAKIKNQFGFTPIKPRKSKL